MMKANEARERSILPQFESVKEAIKTESDLGHTRIIVSGLLPEVVEMLAEDSFDLLLILKDNNVLMCEISWDAKKEDGERGQIKEIEVATLNIEGEEILGVVMNSEIVDFFKEMLCDDNMDDEYSFFKEDDEAIFEENTLDIDNDILPPYSVEY